MLSTEIKTIINVQGTKKEAVFFNCLFLNRLEGKGKSHPINQVLFLLLAHMMLDVVFSCHGLGFGVKFFEVNNFAGASRLGVFGLKTGPFVVFLFTPCGVGCVSGVKGVVGAP